jgi:hypothetical protein
MSTESQSLSNNINALGELCDRYTYPLVAKVLAEIVLDWHALSQADAQLWRLLHQRMTDITEQPDVKAKIISAIKGYSK